MIEPAERSLAGRRLFIHEKKKLLFGYTTGDFPVNALKDLFPAMSLLFLKQIHSARIITANEWHDNIEADGILLERREVVAVIKTADCLPLFFFDDERNRGGVLHVGWRGLQQGIEERLFERLGGTCANFSFFLGPAIEGSCYEVGQEVRDLFAAKFYADAIFSESRPKKYLLDLKAGLKMSLKALGVIDERIGDCGRCTFCSGGLFPSFRRDNGSNKRIFNFLALKDNKT